MNIAQANTIPIEDYLQAKGHSPVRVSHNGNTLWYISPIRPQEKTASFKVDKTLQKWYDHGLDVGGKTVDVVVQMFQCNVSDALHDIASTNLYKSQNNHGVTHGRNLQHVKEIFAQNRFATEKEKILSHAFKLTRTENIKHPALIEYLQERKINLTVAKKYLTQIYFSQASGTKQFFALGWKSGQGYEARNKIFKGFVGVGKNITHLKIENSAQCLIFEGFMDFLSYLSFNNISKLDKSAIIMNSTALKKNVFSALEKENYDKIILFLDNDHSGTKAFEHFKKYFQDKCLDMRSTYQGFNDYNDWVVNQGEN